MLLPFGLFVIIDFDAVIFVFRVAFDDHYFRESSTKKNLPAPMKSKQALKKDDWMCIIIHFKKYATLLRTFWTIKSK